MFNMIMKKKDNPAAGIEEQARQALLAWKNAQNYFENVTDPDLVEYAVYDLEAAKRRYTYMLKCAREYYEYA